MSKIIAHRGRKPFLWPDFLFDLTHDGKDHAGCLKLLHNVTDSMIRERLNNPPESVTDDVGEDCIGRKPNRVAFLDLLLQIHREDKSLTLENIREEVDTFMFEGHDTTASAISWAIYQIGRHPGIQARLHEEIDQVFGDSDRPVTSDDLSKLPYLSRVVKESLRILPSVPIVQRTLEEDITLGGNQVPKETAILIDIYNLHQDPEQFPDPDRFDPDRFLPEKVAKRHPFAYVPFSAGPRNCIGQKFALMEDKVVLINLLRKFSFEAVQTIDEVKPAGQLLIRPADGDMLVKIMSRK